MRIACTAQAAQTQHLGGSPMSMEYAETFEALQRGTVDCTLGQLVPSAEAGIFEVAPHLGYTTEETSSHAVPVPTSPGSGFKDLPLAYQQIIFDSNATGLRRRYGGRDRRQRGCRAAGEGGRR